MTMHALSPSLAKEARETIRSAIPLPRKARAMPPFRLVEQSPNISAYSRSLTPAPATVRASSSVIAICSEVSRALFRAGSEDYEQPSRDTLRLSTSLLWQILNRVGDKEFGVSAAPDGSITVVIALGVIDVDVTVCTDGSMHVSLYDSAEGDVLEQQFDTITAAVEFIVRGL